MVVAGSALEKVDAALSDIFSGWSLSSTVIVTLLFFFLIYPWLTYKDPDVHPFVLSRQATASPVRQPGESVAFRSTEVPYGYPLRSGLNIKSPEGPKWSSGRNGNLRDIWTQVMKGPVQHDGSHDVSKGKFITVLGREQVLEHSLDSVNLEIAMIGEYIQNSPGKRAAICLSNSVELLASIFAAVFHGVHPIIIPYGTPTESLIQHLGNARASVLIAEAGEVQIDQVMLNCPRLSHIIAVTKPGNEHMDFTEIAGDVRHEVEISTWHDLVEQGKSSAPAELPPPEQDLSNSSVTIVENRGSSVEGVQYTSENIVAAVGALISTLPRNQKLRSDDVILSIAPLSSQYPLILTFAALFSNATVAFNSVAGDDVDFGVATSTISPTVIVASSRATWRYHQLLTDTHQGILPKLSRHWQSRSLRNGNMPTTPSFGAPSQSDSTSNLRLLSIYHQAVDMDTPRLSTTDLADLKIALGTRTVYALTAPGVAGALCQTNIFDYRETRDQPSHFGPPLSSLELVLAGKDEKVGAAEPQGQIVARGPAVNGGETKLNRIARINADCTLSLV